MLVTEQLDSAAVALIGYDVLLLDDADMIRPTPCDGWTVADQLAAILGRDPAWKPTGSEWPLCR